MKYNSSHFLDKLIEHEGMVLKVYQDTLGIDTIGIGRNLKDRGISKEELDYMDIPNIDVVYEHGITCLLYTSPSPRDGLLSRMPSSA